MHLNLLGTYDLRGLKLVAVQEVEEKVLSMMGGKLDKMKEVVRGDLTDQFTDIIREAVADLDMGQAEFQVCRKT